MQALEDSSDKEYAKVKSPIVPASVPSDACPSPINSNPAYVDECKYDESNKDHNEMKAA